MHHKSMGDAMGLSTVAWIEIIVPEHIVLNALIP